MPSHSLQSYPLSGIRALIAEEAKELLKPPLATIALALVAMSIMVIGAILLGAWWDRLSTGM